MAIRTPRGYGRNVPPYNEVCEGDRPNVTALPIEAYTGLAHVRVDEYNHDPFVIDAGTIVGLVSYTGADSTVQHKVIPAVLPSTTGTAEADVVLAQKGSAEAATTWGLPGGVSGDTTVGFVRPQGICYSPVYSFNLQERFTNYQRAHNVGFLCDHVIRIPATNSEEVAIENGNLVGLGSGYHHGAGWTDAEAFSTHLQAGRFAKFDATWAFAQERVVGRCMRKVKIGSTSTDTSTTSISLQTSIDAGTFTIDPAFNREMGNLAAVQTYPGAGLSGSGTSGVPSFLMAARADTTGAFWMLVIRITG